MKVSTPLGDYPYEVVRVTLRGRRMLVEGRMGEWETTMEIGPSDLAELGRRARRPLAAVAAVLALRQLLKRSQRV